MTDEATSRTTRSLRGRPRPLLISVLACVLALLATLAAQGPPPHVEAATQPPQSPSASSSPWDGSYFPNVELVSHDGRRFRFYDDLVKDKIVVINFLYTSCTNICPLTTARLAAVKDRLGDAVGRDIFFYSITLDPEMDGPELLKTYAETYHAGAGWLFLTGTPADVGLVRYKLGERSRELAEHRNDVMLGNGRTGEWGRDSAFSDIEQLEHAIRSMDPAWRSAPRSVRTTGAKATAPIDITAATGQGLFMKACAACHTIGSGDLVGPDLAGVTARRDGAWLLRFVKEPDRMRAEKDPVVMEMDSRYPNVRMPNLGLSEQDAKDVLVYLAGHATSSKGEDSTPGIGPVGGPDGRNAQSASHDAD